DEVKRNADPGAIGRTLAFANKVIDIVRRVLDREKAWTEQALSRAAAAANALSQRRTNLGLADQAARALTDTLGEAKGLGAKPDTPQRSVGHDAAKAVKDNAEILTKA